MKTTCHQHLANQCWTNWRPFTSFVAEQNGPFERDPTYQPVWSEGYKNRITAGQPNKTRDLPGGHFDLDILDQEEHPQTTGQKKKNM